MFKWLDGKKTYLLGTIKFVAGVAVAVFLPDAYLKAAGLYIAIDGATDITTRLGIANQVDEEKIANKVIRWAEKRFGK